MKLFIFSIYNIQTQTENCKKYDSSIIVTINCNSLRSLTSMKNILMIDLGTLKSIFFE